MTIWERMNEYLNVGICKKKLRKEGESEPHTHTMDGEIVTQVFSNEEFQNWHHRKERFNFPLILFPLHQLWGYSGRNLF